MFRLLCVLPGLFLVFSAWGNVESEGTSSTALGELRRLNKKFSEDKSITDNELKAQAGSLSRYSLKFDLSYAGPPINNLHETEMPNPTQSARPNRTNLSGYTGLRYRMSSQEALNLSTGVKWYTPYHQIAGEHVNKHQGDKDYEVANPQLSYDRTYLIDKTQARSSVKVGVTTQDYYLNKGQIGSFGLAQSGKYAILDSKWVVGGEADFDLYFFNREYDSSADGRISNYVISLIPSLEYKLTDRFAIRTSVAYSFNNYRKLGSWWLWDEQLGSQRLGVGWSLSRTIYFSPYLSFFPDKPAIRTTSASFSTVFSIF